jgi:hypothetical protein
MFVVILMLPGSVVFAADDEPKQDDFSKALNSTATQWSFQSAYQSTTWKDDVVNGQPRNPGLDYAKGLKQDTVYISFGSRW